MRKAFIGISLFFLLVPAVIFAQFEETKTIGVGANLVITLNTHNPDFHWEVEQSPDNSLLFLTGQPKSTPDGSNATGSRGKEDWTFRAMGPGETTLRFYYVNDKGDRDSSQEKVYNVIINRE